MTNRQLNFENIDKVENLNYTPLEKKYLKVQTVKTILVISSLWDSRFCSFWQRSSPIVW